MVTKERKLVTIKQAEELIRGSRNSEEAIEKLHNLPVRKSKYEHPPNGYIHLSEAARTFSRPKSTLSRWRKNRIITDYIEIGNRLYLNEKELRHIINKYNKNPGQGKKTMKQ